MKTEPVRPDVSRRAFFGTALGSAAAAGLSLSFPKAASARAALPAHGLANLIDDESAPEQLLSSLKGAFSFLDTMMDAYASGPTIRLIQSYSDALFAPFSPVAFTYDNAVAIQAYLARGTSDDLQRAQILGNGLIVAQATNFPVNDGRFAQAYYVNVPNSSGAFITPAAFPFFFYSSSVGDQAWTGMALAQLYKHTRNAAYLNAAVNVANWIVTNTYDTAGAGGYRFGTNINPSNQSVPSTNGKSTEHNIDTYAFFNMLASLTHGGLASNGSSWSSLAQHALVFVEAMFNSTGGFFYTGTDSDQITIATGNIPEDVQTWSYLALLNKTYGVSIDWVKTNLATLDTPSCPLSALKANICVQGETYATASLASAGNDEHAVWLEGTAHTASAMLARRLSPQDDIGLFHGDVLTAFNLLQNIALAQANLGGGQTVNGHAIPPGEGVTASTGNLDTGFGFNYFPNLHIGATGWFALALLAKNPFQLSS
jgi:hypothetical protein